MFMLLFMPLLPLLLFELERERAERRLLLEEELRLLLLLLRGDWAATCCCSELSAWVSEELAPSTEALAELADALRRADEASELF
jgi:hypothetical protein